MKKITNFYVFITFTFLAFSFNPTKAMNDETTTPLLQGMEQEPTIINLTQKWRLEECIHITQKTVINGNDNILYLKKGNIIIKEGAELILENVIIKGLKETNIFCAGPNSKIKILGNVTWVLSGNYKFWNGSFQVLENSKFTIIKNPKIKRTVERTLHQLPYFAYLATEVSCIANNAKLIMSNITFYYNPQKKPFTLDEVVSILFPKRLSQNIILNSKSSTLSLNNVTLRFTITPLKLTNGILELANTIQIISRVENSLILEEEGSSLKVNVMTHPVSLMSKIKKGKGQYQEIDPIYMIQNLRIR